jgi:hypothetical protein
MRAVPSGAAYVVLGRELTNTLRERPSFSAGWHFRVCARSGSALLLKATFHLGEPLAILISWGGRAMPRADEQTSPDKATA